MRCGSTAEEPTVSRLAFRLHARKLEDFQAEPALRQGSFERYWNLESWPQPLRVAEAQLGHAQQPETTPPQGKCLRDRADRSGFPVGSAVPAVAGPAFADEASDDDDCVGEGDERIDDSSVHFGADGKFLEPAVVP